MKQTHVLEFGKTELSLDELIKVAEIAVRRSETALFGELNDCMWKPQYTTLEYEGARREQVTIARRSSLVASEAAQDYAAAWNTLYALLESRDREITVRKEPRDAEGE